MESGVLLEYGSQPKGYGYLFFINIVFSIVFSVLLFGVNIADVAKNWPKYRCSPIVMPFASFYGYNTSENFNYCLQGIFNGSVGKFTSPFSSILGTFVGTLMTMLQSVNSLRLMLATLMGGVTKTFQEITTRFKTLVNQMFLTVERLKMLMGRMFATFYAVVYMGTSGMTAGMNFSRTVLFSFLDTFCFAPTTKLKLANGSIVQIQNVEIGQILESGAEVIARYEVAAIGQPMVSLFTPDQDIAVSANHYVKHPTTKKWIRAENHPDVSFTGPWRSHKPLICLDTNTHEIKIGSHIFSDYIETNTTDNQTMQLVDRYLNNGLTSPIPDSYTYEPSLAETERIKLADGTYKSASEIKLFDKLSTGEVYGIVKRIQSDMFKVENTIVSATASIWSPSEKLWIRACNYPNAIAIPGLFRTYNFLVMDSATIETKYIRMRDLMEVHSPDLEKPTSEALLA